MSELISAQDLLVCIKQKISESFHRRLEEYLLQEPNDENRSDNAEKWISWTEAQRTYVKSVVVPVPQGILPGSLQGVLRDVRIQCRGPDDKVYDRNELLRKRVARGNCILELMEGAGRDETSRSDCVIFALKKFTGGLGDDDDRDIDDGFKWQKYFTKKISEAENVICTRKMNGEAAHFAVRWIANEFYIIAGSKNVHLIFRSVDDIALYSDTRYMVARDVALACFAFFSAMDVSTRNMLFSFFHHTKLTAVLEILFPTYQHVENLSYLSASKLYFISWSRTDLDENYEDEICISPDLGQAIAKIFGLAVTGYDVIPHTHDALAAKMLEIRKGHGYEGDVLYFVDSQNAVIGLLKKKTIWYIIVRAIREKARRIQKKGSTSIELSDTVQQTRKRLTEIQKWLGLDAGAARQWKDLAEAFLNWVAKSLKATTLKMDDLYKVYPVVWTRFLRETKSTDKIGLDHLTIMDDPDDLTAGPKVQETEELTCK